MKSESFSIDVGGSKMPSYLARPDTNAPLPAVIVLQEIFGVNTEVKRITDLLASSGFVALAINYYHRTHPDLNEPYTPDGLKNGFAAAGQVSRETLLTDVAAAIGWLDAQDFVKTGSIGTWGFCFGGAVAFLTATLPGVRAAACFYGGSIASPFPNGEPAAMADAAKIRAPLLLAFGGKDDYITREHVEQIRAALEQAGKTFEIVVYPEQGHAFFRNSDLSQSDVADAWRRVQAFFEKNLG
ncbi:MAG TPA: dienelactone hydrolase family protein [Candidatus Elarobacter sp.]